MVMGRHHAIGEREKVRESEREREKEKEGGKEQFQCIHVRTCM